MRVYNEGGRVAFICDVVRDCAPQYFLSKSTRHSIDACVACASRQLDWVLFSSVEASRASWAGVGCAKGMAGAARSAARRRVECCGARLPRFP